MISVVVPTFNEAAQLPGCLEALRGQAAHELIVADGGSTDGTGRFATEAGAVLVICEHRQRAAQMNLGAARAAGDILLFLHADTRLPAGALIAVERAVCRRRRRRLLPSAVAGASPALQRWCRSATGTAAPRAPLSATAACSCGATLFRPPAASRHRRSWRTLSSAAGCKRRRPRRGAAADGASSARHFRRQGGAWVAVKAALVLRPL